jgi:hypothetical protein
VVVLSKAVSNIAPASLPPAGLFDQMKANGTLNGQKFTAVGYGGHEPIVGVALRCSRTSTPARWPFSSFNALNNVWLRLSQNNAHGDSGTWLRRLGRAELPWRRLGRDGHRRGHHHHRGLDVRRHERGLPA